MPHLGWPFPLPVRSRDQRRRRGQTWRPGRCQDRFLRAPMNEDQLRALLEEVRQGSTGVDAALDRVRHLPFEDLGFANIDHHRALRHGIPEVVFAMGKTTEQVIAIASRLLEHQGNILITRTDPSMAREIMAVLPGGESFPSSGAIRFLRDDTMYGKRK